MSIVEWLREQIDTDEQNADEVHLKYDCDLRALEFFGDCSCDGPVRARRQAQTYRRMLSRHSSCGTGVGYCDNGGHGVEAHENNGQRGCGDLFDLASIYSHRPGYLPEWAPEEVTA